MGSLTGVITFCSIILSTVVFDYGLMCLGTLLVEVTNIGLTLSCSLILKGSQFISDGFSSSLSVVKFA